MNGEEIMCKIHRQPGWKWMTAQLLPESEGRSEEERSRCQPHTSHVAVVDLAPLSVHPSCTRFSPVCQDVGSISRRGVKRLVCVLWLPSNLIQESFLSLLVWHLNGVYKSLKLYFSSYLCFYFVHICTKLFPKIRQ